MRAAIYLRLSKDSETSTSVERQRRACRDFAAGRGWEIVHEAEDVDVSGSKVAPWDRPGFSEILARGDVDVILAYRLDRVARSVSDFSLLLRRLDASGVAFVSATEPFDLTQPMGKVLVYLTASFAELEADAIGTRVRSSIATLRRSSRWSHGRAPYGYRIVQREDGPGKTLALDPVQAPIVREAASRVLAGETPYAVVRDLQGRGVPTLSGAGWTETTLRRMLTSDHLLGRVRHRGALVRLDDGEPFAPFPPVVDVEMLERLRAILEDRQAQRPDEAARLLSRLLSCASCGRTLSVSGRADGPRDYVCRSRTHGHRCDRPVSISAPLAEDHVSAAFLDRFGDLEAVRRVKVPDAVPVGLADLDAQIREAASLLVSADDDTEALALLRRLKARRAEFRTTPGGVRLEPLGMRVREAWESGLDPDRRALLADVLAEAKVHPSTRGRREEAGKRLSERISVSWRP